jgi:hypothetical protein
MVSGCRRGLRGFLIRVGESHYLFFPSPTVLLREESSTDCALNPETVIADEIVRAAA